MPDNHNNEKDHKTNMPRAKTKEVASGDILDIIEIGPNGLISSRHYTLEYLGISESEWVEVIAASKPNKVLLAKMEELNEKT